MEKQSLQQRFRSSIKRGTGEAYLLMRKNPTVDFSRDILKAALHNLAYDAQCEGSRADYVFRLIQLSDKKEKIRKAILKKLATERRDDHALVQLFDLAALFAKQGDAEARAAVYKRYGRKVISGCDWAGQDALVAIDGIEGLKHIANVQGEELLRNKDAWEDSSFVDHFQKEHPDIKVYAELRKAAKSSPAIKKYLDVINQGRPVWAKGKKPVYTYAAITAKINSEKYFPLYWRAAEYLSKQDVIKLADDFLKEKDRVRQERYLVVFRRVQFPYNYAPILKIAQGKKSSRDRLVNTAVDALQFFKGDDIRAFALKQIHRKRDKHHYIRLLKANYKEGDGKLLHALVRQTNNEHFLHNLACYTQVYEANKTKECKAPLVALYDKLTCGLCRHDIVKVLLENVVLPERIKREMQYDSNEETRQLSR